VLDNGGKSFEGPKLAVYNFTLHVVGRLDTLPDHSSTGQCLDTDHTHGSRPFEDAQR
jgi:hypothetical protein